MFVSDWLSPFAGDPYSAYCRTCHSKLHAHKKGLLAHAKSSKHRKHLLTPSEVCLIFYSTNFIVYEFVISNFSPSYYLFYLLS